MVPCRREFRLPRPWHKLRRRGIHILRVAPLRAAFLVTGHEPMPAFGTRPAFGLLAFGMAMAADTF